MSVNAAPYASGITNVGGTPPRIAYYLNVTPAAGAVTITCYPSGGSPTFVPATPTAGSNSFVLGTGTSSASDTSYTISVAQIGSGVLAPEPIASANSAQTNWGGSPDPRGLDVNCYPANGPAFGTVYAANGGAGTGHGLGLFPTHSDMSYAFGATTAGLDSATFSGGAAGSAPYKVGVSRVDGTVLVSAIDPTVGGVWAFNPYLQNPMQLLAKGNGTCHGEIYGAPRCTGSLANGNFVLYTYDYTLPPVSSNLDTFMGGAIGFGASYFVSYIEGQTAVNGGVGYDNVCRYTIGGTAGLPVTTAPDLLYNYGLNYSGGGLPASIDIDTNGNIFSTSERSAVGSAPWCMVMSSNMETNLYLSATSASADVLEAAIASHWDAGGDVAGCLISVSPDDKFVALAGYNGYLAVFGMTNGLPNASALTLVTNAPVGDAAPRGVAFDMADNVYLMNNDTGLITIYDLGLTETCISSNDLTTMNGSFTLVPAPTISVTATTPDAFQANNSYAQNGATPTPAVFTLTLSAAQELAYNAKFTLTGTSTNGVNYTVTNNGTNLPAASTYYVTFPAGTTSETVSITPTASPVSGPTLTTILTVSSNNGVLAAAPTSATAYIINSGPQVVFVSGSPASTMYRGLTNDFVTFTVSRYGDTNCGVYSLPPAMFTIGGTAAYGTDYAGGPQPYSYSVGPPTYSVAPSAGVGSAVTVSPGNASVTVEMGIPLTHTSYTGNLTITLQAVGGTSPEGTNVTAAAGTGTATLLDNLTPPEAVIWSDPLTSADDSANWTVTWQENGTAAVPPAPATFVFPNYNNTPTQDFDVDFGYDSCSTSGDALTVPPSGNVNTLRMTVNKNSSLNSGGYGSGVNCYPAPGFCPVLSGNYAIRFEMYIVLGCNPESSSEFAVFGMNHYGTNCNWFEDSGLVGGTSFSNTYEAAGSNIDVDGVFFVINAQPASINPILGYPADFLMMTGTNSTGANKFYPSTGYWVLNGAAASSYANVFKTPYYNTSGTPYGYNDIAYDGSLESSYGSAFYGAPVNASSWTDDNYSTTGNSDTYDGCPAAAPVPTNGVWTDVELRQSNGVITMSLNKTVMFTYTMPAANPFTNGYPMLGYFDPYIGQGTGGGVYYSDIRAVGLGAAITNQPVGATIGVGTNYTFNLGAVGLGMFTNTWYYTNAGTTTQVHQDVVSGPYNDSDSYTITSATTANTGKYYVVVQDASGTSITSSVVTLTVDLPAAISSGPNPVTVYQGGPATFSVTATGQATLIYQWQTNGVNLTTTSLDVSGAVTNSSLSLTNVSLALNGETYGVIVTNSYGKATNTALLTVLASALNGISNMVTNGSSISFQFTSTDPYDTTNSFYLLESTNLQVPAGGTNAYAIYGFTNVSPLPAGTFTGTNASNFMVTYPTNGANPQQFFQVEHK